MLNISHWKLRGRINIIKPPKFPLNIFLCWRMREIRFQLWIIWCFPTFFSKYLKKQSQFKGWTQRNVVLFNVFMCPTHLFSQRLSGWTDFSTQTALDTKWGHMAWFYVVSTALRAVTAFCALGTKLFRVHCHLRRDQIIQLLKCASISLELIIELLKIGCGVLCMVSDHMFPKGVSSCTDLVTDFANHPMMVFNMISFYVTGYVWLGFA